MRRQSEKTFEKVGLVIMIMFWVCALVALSEAARADELKPAPQPQQQVAAPQKAAQKKSAPVRKTVVAPRTPAQAQPQSSDQEQVTLTRFILVSISDRQLALVDNGQVVKLYKVAVGKDGTPSPEGSFSVVKRTENPAYFHEGKVIPPGKDNPVGTRWIGLSMKGYGIHGTNAPRSIGKAASHGCIRMSRKDVEELFALIKIGDTVEIRNGGEELVAQVFHPETLVAGNSDETPSSADAGQE